MKLDGNIKNEIQKNNDPDPLKITIGVDACVESITGGVRYVHARTRERYLTNIYSVAATRETTTVWTRPANHRNRFFFNRANPRLPKKGEIKESIEYYDTIKEFNCHRYTYSIGNSCIETERQMRTSKPTKLKNRQKPGGPFRGSWEIFSRIM